MRRSVADAVAACAGAVRENIRLRRACHLGAGTGVVASYLHASPAPGLGRMGALVRLESASGRLEGAAADVAQVGPAPWLLGLARVSGWSRVREWHLTSACVHGLIYSEQTSFLSRSSRPVAEQECEGLLLLGKQDVGAKLAMHVVAARPMALDRQGIPAEALAGGRKNQPGLRGAYRHDQHAH